MANGSSTNNMNNRAPKHKRSSLTKHSDAAKLDDNNISLSPLYDIFDHQLQYSLPSNTPSLPCDPHPLNYYPHPGATEFPLLYIKDDARKRQRRQTAGNLVVNTFFNRGNNSAAGPLSMNSTSAIGSGGATGAAKAPKKKQSTAQPRPLIAVPPMGIGPVHDPNVNDVLSGRGGRINAHVGNVQFREIVAERKKDYLAKDTKKLEKAHIAADIVYFIRRLDPPGRFLKEDANGAWWDIGDQKAIKKVGQALREDAPDIRDPDEMDGTVDVHGDVTTITKSADVPGKIPSSSSTESTPTQTNRTIAVTSDSSSIPPPIPTVTTSGGSNVIMGNKVAGIISGRGGKLSHTSSNSSIRSNQGGGSSQQQQQQQPASVQIDIRPPDSYKTIVPTQPQRRVGQGGTPFYNNLGFRSGLTQRVGAAVSGAAAAVMKQQQQPPGPIHEFEVPAARHSSSQDEAFGRTFHAPPDTHHGESSLISGLSGGASAVSGMSGISALTDPMSSVSNSDVFHHGQSRAIRQAQLDRIRHNWASPAAITASDNTPTIQLLNTSTGIGNSLNNSAAMRMTTDHMDDGMSWTHSLHGGGIGSILEDTVRDDSVLCGGTGSLLSAGSGGNYSFGGFSATSGSGLLGASKHSKKSASHLGTNTTTRNNVGGLSAYYPGDVSVTSGMSIASAGVDSLPSMSELSENLVALDLANNGLGHMHDNEI